MKSETGNFSNALLTGTILLANVDVNGLLDYGLKALLGGAIWLGYKLTAEFVDRKRKTNSHGRNKQDNSGDDFGSGNAGDSNVL